MVKINNITKKFLSPLLFIVMLLFLSISVFAVNPFGLDDNTNKINNVCYTSKYNFNITSYPCDNTYTSNSNVIQYMDFEYNGLSTQNTDIYFIYSEKIKYGKVYLENLKNRTINYQIPNYVYNSSNSSYYILNYNSSYYLEYYIESIDITNLFIESNDIGLNNSFVVYKVKDINFQPNQKYKVRFEFLPEKPGKFHIFLKRTSDTLSYAVNNKFYIYQDPTYMLTGFEYLANSTLAYYDFELGTGTYIPSRTGKYGLLANATVNYSTGKIGNFSYLNNVTSNYAGACNTTGWGHDTLDNGYSYTIWANVTQNISNMFLVNTNYFSLRVNAFNSTHINFSSTDYDGTTSPTPNTQFVELNKWSFITVNYNKSSNKQQIWLNGVFQAEGTLNQVNTISRYNCIGNWYAQAYSYRSKLDEIAIFNRTLTGTEINYLYNSGNPDYRQQYNFSSQELSFTINFNFSYIPQNLSIKDTELNITVNITSNENISNNSFNLYVNLSNTNFGHECRLNINGTCNSSGFSNTGIIKNILIPNTSFMFQIPDSLFRITVINKPHIFNVTYLGNYSIYGTNSLVTRFFDFNTTHNTNIILETTAEPQITTSLPLDVYFCRTNTTVTTSCIILGSITNNTQYFDTHNKTSHRAIYFNITNGLINGNYSVNNSPIYILFSSNEPNLAKSWKIAYTNISSNSEYYDGTLQTVTSDTHMHYYHNGDTLNFFVNGTGLTTNTTFNSTIQNLSISFTNLPPSLVNIILPTTNIYTDFLTISHTQATDPNNDLINYKSYLVTNGFLYNMKNYTFSDVPYIFDFRSLNIDSVNSSFIYVESCDSLGSCSITDSNNFIIQKTVSNISGGTNVSVNFDVQTLGLYVLFIGILIGFLISCVYQNRFMMIVMGSLLGIISIIMVVNTWDNLLLPFVFIVPLIAGFWTAIITSMSK